MLVLHSISKLQITFGSMPHAIYCYRFATMWCEPIRTILPHSSIFFDRSFIVMPTIGMRCGMGFQMQPLRLEAHAMALVGINP